MKKKESRWKVLIFSGSGDKSFIAGADIKEMAEMNSEQMEGFISLGQKVSLAFEALPCAVIAAVNGFAFGGGLEMALAADFMYASSTACFALPEVSLGMIPGFGGTQRLSKAIGVRRAKELMMSGRRCSAEEALRWGIVNKICHSQTLIADCLAVAKEINAHSAVAVQQIKKSVALGLELHLSNALEIEKECCSIAFATEERKRGMAMFLKRRSPR